MGSIEENGKTPYEEMAAYLAALKEYDKGWTVMGKHGILAMDRKNDPFYAGQPWQAERAYWFATLFKQLGFEGKRIHLRFIHYVTSGAEPHPETGEYVTTRLPAGEIERRKERLRKKGLPPDVVETYENTDENWAFVLEASKDARNMELVDPRSIIDRRTPRPFVNAPTEPADDPCVELEEPELELPTLEVSALEPTLEYACATPHGYYYDAAYEPSLIEIWVEKDLDAGEDPVIRTLCEELDVNLVTGIGVMTISSIHALLERRAKLGKPLRVLYLSDFDPAGKHMPVSPARHIEFAIRNMDPKPDIRLHHLALTEEQAVDMELPRIPIKDSESRKRKFEKLHGEGAVELNAMMHQSRVADFEELIRNAIKELRDPNLRRKLFDAEMEAQEMLDAEVGRWLHWPHRALELLEEQAREIGERYREELEDLSRRLEAEIAPLRDRAERVRHVTRRRLERIEEELADELPVVEGEEDEDATLLWLFDSRRDYLDQLEYYKHHKGEWEK